MKFLVLINLWFLLYSKSEAKDTCPYPITCAHRSGNLATDVRFFLYTRAHGDVPQQLWVDNNHALEKSAYDYRKKTVFVTHGWSNSYQGLNCKTIRKAHLDRDDCNVIAVDYGNIAKLHYLIVKPQVKAIGGFIAKMISFLKKHGSDPANMTLVGHSLGAHVMGLAGYQATSKVGHIVGLDPGGLGYEDAGEKCGLHAVDATYVEVIHTDSGYYGIQRLAGHVDFFPNGGTYGQPGCGTDIKHYCAHDRAYQFYAEAVRSPGGLLGVRCADYNAFLRGNCDANDTLAMASGPGSAEWPGNKTGAYFMRTEAAEPYGLGSDGLTAAENSRTNWTGRTNVTESDAIFWQDIAKAFMRSA